MDPPGAKIGEEKAAIPHQDDGGAAISATAAMPAKEEEMDAPMAVPQTSAATKTQETPPVVAATSKSSSTVPLPPTNTKHVAKKVKTKHMNPVLLATRRSFQHCCKTNDVATALEVYQKALTDDIRVEAQSFYSLLNLCDGLGNRKIHIGTPKPTTVNTDESNKSNNNNKTVRAVDLEIRKQAAFDIKKRMDHLKIPLNETAYTALVKILTRADDLEAADAVLKEAEGVQQCRVKLRLYAPLIHAFCQKQGHLRSALTLWERLGQQQQSQGQSDLQLGEREYAAIIECCANLKVKDNDNTGNDSNIDANDAANVVKKVFTDLSEDVLVPSKETCGILVQWFQSKLALATADSVPTSENTDKSSSSLLLSDIQLPSSQVGEDIPIGPVVCPAQTHQWAISETCSIDATTGTLLDGCLQGKILQPIQLSSKAWHDMLTMNETIVLSGKLDRDTSAFQGGKKGKKRKLGGNDQELRVNHWKRFQAFLDTNKNSTDETTYDVIIDGANVGYFQQNFAGAPKHTDYRQIDSVVQHFVNLGKKVLLVMHQRHFAKHQIPARFRPILDNWNQHGTLYQTPAGMNDDWFWMHAALVLGPGTLVLTNDEMRDHHFQMLSPRSFLRWKDRHQVHFHFGDASTAPATNSNGFCSRPVVLEYPEIYSRRIQRVADGYAIPHPKRGDENRFLDGAHDADDAAPEEETYLCIRQVPTLSAANP